MPMLHLDTGETLPEGNALFLDRPFPAEAQLQGRSVVKLSISGDQISFFERYGYVELENFFSTTAVQKLALGVAAEVERRRRGEAADCNGRDLALSSEAIRSVLFSSSLTKSAFAFLRKRPLRYAFDQVLEGFSPEVLVPSPECVCVGPIVLSALICIRPPQRCEAVHPVKSILASPPMTAGGVIFISPKTVCQPQDDFGGEYILLGYGGGHLMYRPEEKDPCNHALKRYGYLLNDSLKLSTHPLLLREIIG